MKSWKVFLALVLMSPLYGWASALVQKDETNHRLVVSAQMHFFTYRSSWNLEPVAKLAATQISTFWNEPKTTVALDGKDYRVEFVIGYDVVKSVNVEGSSCAENFITVNSSGYPSSFYDKLGAQSGWFLLQDLKKYPSTTAHEFGHGLMLDHDDRNQITAEVPGIMFDRTTLVQPKYQWDPKVSAGLNGGTINPKFRKVRDQDVRRIPFNQIQFNAEGFGCLGDGANRQVEILHSIKID